MKSRLPSTGERLARALGHFGFFIGAIYALFGHLPRSIENAVDPLQLAIIALFMSTGLLGAWAAWRGRFMLEYVTIPFMFGASIIYAVAMAGVVITGTNRGSGFALILVSVLACYQASRWLSLNQLLDGPVKLLLKRRTGKDE